MSKHILWFVSHHGFGHAARSAATMRAWLQSDASHKITIVSAIPKWFFDESIPDQTFSFINESCDVGLVQKNPFEADIPQTIRELNAFYPVNHQWINRIHRQVNRPNAVVCDISPAGLAYAAHFNLPSILLENFTWSWLYEPYTANYPEFQPFIDSFKTIENSATFRIQTIPFCDAIPGAFKVPPIARLTHAHRDHVRSQLGIDPKQKMILVTLGGIDSRINLPHVEHHNSVFVIAGGTNNIEKSENVLRLPHHSGFYHPDLVAASDAVIGKLGYSTLAETAVFGKPLLFLCRKYFRETEPLSKWTLENLPSIATFNQIPDESEINRLFELLNNHKTVVSQNGAFLAANKISQWIGE